MTLKYQNYTEKMDFHLLMMPLLQHGGLLRLTAVTEQKEHPSVFLG